jgi:hypothetical protein
VSFSRDNTQIKEKREKEEKEKKRKEKLTFAKPD